MATPLDATEYRTLTALLLIGAGDGTTTANPLSGTVRLTPDVDPMVLPGGSPKALTLFSSPTDLTLDANGECSGLLLRTDSTATARTGWTYKVEYILNASGVPVHTDPFHVRIPAGSGPLNLSTTEHVAASQGTVSTQVVVDPSLILATPYEPAWYDNDGTMSDAASVPDIVGIDWLMNGSPILPGYVYMTGYVTITPVAKAGYRLPDGQQPYTHTFSTASATRVTPPAVTFIQTDTEKSYTIPVAPTGVQYTDSMSNVLAAGTVPVTGGTYQFYAQALAGYALDGATFWYRNFDLIIAVPNVSFDDVAKTFTVDAVTGVTYYNGSGQFAPTIAPGTYNAVDYGNSVTLVARADSGYQILPETQSQFTHQFV